METIASRFQRWYAATSVANHPVWGIPCNLSDLEVIEALLDLIDDDQFTSRNRATRMESYASLCSVTQAICDDLCDISACLTDDHITDQTACLVAAVTAATRPAGMALDAGDLRATRSWLLRCLLNDGKSNLVRIGLPTLLTHPDQLFPTNLLTPIVARFAEVLFIYDQFTGQLNDITRQWFGSLETWLLCRLPFRLELANLALILIRWADRREVSHERLCTLTRRFADEGVLDAEVAPRAAVLFARLANRNRLEDPVQLAHAALTQFSGRLTGTELVELVGILAANRPHEAVREAPRILHMIDVCMLDWYSTTPDELLMADRRGAHFVLIGNIVSAFLEAGRADLAVLALGAWLNVPPNERRQDILVWLITNNLGVGWATGKCVSLGPSPVDLTEFIRATGVLRGLSPSIIDAPGFEPIPVRRPGVPDVGGGTEAADLLSGMVVKDRLDDVMERFGGEAPKAVIPLLNAGLPPQPILLRNTGWSLPWTVTLRKPRPDRPVRFVRLILTGTESGLMEIHGVESILRKQGLAVDLHTSPDLGVDRFLELYRDRNPDVIWVVGHGEFVHDDPQQTRLPLPDGSCVSAGQLRKEIPSSEARRLLVLNLCDSATAVMWGGLPEYGLGVLSASPTQAVIGHAWPVVGWPDAALFGRLVAASLANSTFYTAYEHAVRILLGGRESVIKALDGSAGELDSYLLTAMEGHHGDRLKAYATWGSPAFLE